MQNVLFFILFVSTLISLFYDYKTIENIDGFKNSYQNIKTTDSVNKPIILMISDEYNSPIGLSKAFRDSSVFDFSKMLVKKGWKVKNSFYSHETSTIHSLSSLFNFNLSHDSIYSKQNINQIGPKKLIKSLFADSLNKKHIEIINYGIFDLGNSNPLTRLYYYPKNFLEELLCYSVYPSIFYNSDGLKLKGLKNTFYPSEGHNKIILSSLADTLSKQKNLNCFIYVHLFMPHGPMVLAPDFKLQIESPEHYLAYWKFTNKKLGILLDKITAKNNCRIILTGDHGYRSDPSRINPKYTFTAFYGFDQKDVDQLKSVQDIGSLVNGYFK
ncbi:MAG: sulfatase-like hydrolase/transferase [Chitinophagaceae bacterium]|nr:sulfatase-like hydrolase/transferase [Chitinophagaceae bacterium]